MSALPQSGHCDQREDGDARTLPNPADLSLRRAVLQGRNDLARSIWLGDEMNADGHLHGFGHQTSRRKDKANQRPTVPYQARELQSVHRAGHVDVRQDHGNMGTTFQHNDGFISIGGLHGGIARIFHDIHRGHANERFVIDHQYACMLQVRFPLIGGPSLLFGSGLIWVRKMQRTVGAHGYSIFGFSPLTALT